MPSKILTIEKPVSGWGKVNGNTYPLEGKIGQYSYSQFMSPFRDNRLGHWAPGEMFTALSDAGSRVTALPIAGNVASSGEAFCLLANARLVQFGVGDSAIDAKYDVTAHAGHNVQTTLNGDSLIVRDLASTPVEWVIRFWEDDVDADAGIIKIDGTSQDDDRLSTYNGSGVLTKGVPLKAILAQESIIHFTHGQYIGEWKITGDLSNNGGATISRSKLNLGAGWVATSLCKYGPYTAVVGYRATLYAAGFASGECRVWLWNGASPNPNESYPINDNYAGRIFVDGGVLKVITNGNGGMTTVWKFTGSGFEEEFYRPTAAIGSAPFHNSLDEYQHVTHWGMGSGNNSIVAYDNGAFHYRAHPYSDTSSIAQIGMVKTLSSNGLHAGVKIGSNYYITRIDGSKYYPNSTAFTRLYKLPFKSTIERIIPYFSQWGSGSSIQFSLFKGYSTSGDLLNKTLDAATLGTTNPDFAIQQLIDDISWFWIEMTFNHANATDTAAVLAALEVEYSYNYQI